MALLFIRSGVELPDGAQSVTGDRVYLPIEAARALLQRGAATEAQ